MMSSGPLTERFEQRVIFRLARWLPLLLGGLATVALIGAVVALLYAVTPTREPAEPKPVTPPEPVQLKLSEVQQHLDTPAQPNPTDDAEPGSLPNEDQPSVSGQSRSAALQEFLKTVDALQAQLQRHGLSLVNLTETRCDSYYDDGSCAHTTEVVVTEAQQDLFQLLSLYDVDSENKPQRQDTAGGLSLTVADDDSLPTKTRVMKELIDILAQAKSAAQAQRLLDGWVALRREREHAQRQAFVQQQEAQQAAYAEALQKQHDTQTKKAELRTQSMMAIAGGLSLLVFCGLVLAVMALERHSRAMQALLAQRAGSQP